MRIGHGYDVHKLLEGEELILGGVKIDNDLGLYGHSDADVLVHAIMDALLGAAGLGDIGLHFPDTSDKYYKISSLKLLEDVRKLLESKQYFIENIDCTIVMQKPKLRPYMDEMINNISKVLYIDKTQINIKATTEEKLGFTGRSEGVKAYSVCLISPMKDSFLSYSYEGCDSCKTCCRKQ